MTNFPCLLCSTKISLETINEFIQHFKNKHKIEINKEELIKYLKITEASDKIYNYWKKHNENK